MKLMVLLFALVGLTFAQFELIGDYSRSLENIKSVQLYDGEDGSFYGNTLERQAYILTPNEVTIQNFLTGEIVETITIPQVDSIQSVYVTKYWFDSDSDYEILFNISKDNVTSFEVYDGMSKIFQGDGAASLWIVGSNSYLVASSYDASYTNSYIKSWKLRSNITSTSRSRSSIPSTSIGAMQMLNNSLVLSINGAVNSDITANIYDLSGRLIQSLNSDQLKSGTNIINLSNQASGVYIPVIQTGSQQVTGKVIVK